jgi:hypothetical protein
LWHEPRCGLADADSPYADLPQLYVVGDFWFRSPLAPGGAECSHVVLSDPVFNGKDLYVYYVKYEWTVRLEDEHPPLLINDRNTSFKGHEEGAR